MSRDQVFKQSGLKFVFNFNTAIFMCSHYWYQYDLPQVKGGQMKTLSHWDKVNASDIRKAA